jgi:hypothetical protein
VYELSTPGLASPWTLVREERPSRSNNPYYQISAVCLIEAMKTLREEADHVVNNFLTKCSSQRALSFGNVLSNATFPTQSLSEKDVTDILFLGTPLSAQLGKELP